METAVDGSLPEGHTGARRSLRIVADDLSGATESLAAALTCFPEEIRPRGTVHLEYPVGADHDLSSWHALDLNTRTLSPAEAGREYAAIGDYLDFGPSCVTALKVDSLLRGNVAAAAGAFLPRLQRPVVLAPALPAHGRSTVDGRLQLSDGEAGVGGLEGARTDVLSSAGVPAGVVPLETVRRGVSALREQIDGLAAQGDVAVVDAVTETDLNTVAGAALAAPAAVLIGSSGLIGAAGRFLLTEDFASDVADADPPPCRTASASKGVLVVAGTAEAQVKAQLQALSAAGVPVEHQRSGEPADSVLQRIDHHLRDDVAALRTPSFVHRPQESSTILHSLAALARDSLLRNPRTAAVLTGGATARAVLEELGVHTLELQCRTHGGAAHLQTATGRQVITRPGSHGGTSNLLDLVRHLSPSPSNVLAESSPAAFAQKEGM